MDNEEIFKHTTEETDYVINKIRTFCREKGLIDSYSQCKVGILAACEDPKTISIFNHGGEKWPLPQTGQMQMEVEMLKNPKGAGFYTVTTSYRNEPNPKPGRHKLIFTLFEFEIHGGIEELIKFELELLAYMGFPVKTAMRGNWNSVAKKFGVDDIGHEEEEKLGKKTPIFFLTHFPMKSSPFWNMKLDPSNPKVSLKVDCLLCGMETFGSAERSCNPEEMEHLFKTISDGEYAELLYSKFSKERVDNELNEYFSLFKSNLKRCGGGIGIDRFIRAMKILGIPLKDNHISYGSLRGGFSKKLSSMDIFAMNLGKSPPKSFFEYRKSMEDFEMEPINSGSPPN